MEAFVEFFKNLFFLGLNKEQIYRIFWSKERADWSEIEKMMNNNNHTLLFLGIWVLIILFGTIITIITTKITKKVIKVIKLKNKNKIEKRKEVSIIDN